MKNCLKSCIFFIVASYIFFNIKRRNKFPFNKRRQSNTDINSDSVITNTDDDKKNLNSNNENNLSDIAINEDSNLDNALSKHNLENELLAPHEYELYSISLSSIDDDIFIDYVQVDKNS